MIKLFHQKKNARVSAYGLMQEELESTDSSNISGRYANKRAQSSGIRRNNVAPQVNSATRDKIRRNTFVESNEETISVMQDLEETAEIKMGVRLTQRNINDLIKVFCANRFGKNNDRMATHYIDMTQKM